MLRRWEDFVVYARSRPDGHFRSYADADGVAVTTAGGLSGIQTRGGSVTLTSGAATSGTNQISLLQDIDTRTTPGAGSVNTAGAVILNAAGGGVNQASGSITASGPLSGIIPPARLPAVSSSIHHAFPPFKPLRAPHPRSWSCPKKA